MRLQSYGDLTELNKTKGILYHVGKETLNMIAKSYLDLLDTSSAIYEADGSYASALFSSSYCNFMDKASRGLCATKDNSAALGSGKWLCHESCWTDCSRIAVETGKPFDLRGCKGGINIYAVPIKAEGKAIGAINIGYGNPPDDQEKLRAIAEDYKTDIKEIEREVCQYQPRPEFLVEAAKRNLHLAANLIGEIYTRKKNELAMEDLYNHAPCGYHSLDKDGFVLRINDTELQWLGYTRDDMTGKMKYQDLLPPAGLQTFQEKFLKFKDRGYVHDLELEIMRKDGSVLVGLINATAIYDDNGDFVMSRSTLLDITKRKRAETALKDSEQRLELAIDTISGGAWDWNLVTDALLVSPQWLKSVGYAQGELEPRVNAWKQLLHPDELSMIDDKLQAYFEGKTPIYECEYRLRAKSGVWLWRHDRGKVVAWDANGKPSRMVGVDVDITERKRTEEELKLHRDHLERLVAERTAELKKAHERFVHAEKLSALGKLTGAIAHEFNNPLYGLRNIIEQTLEHLAHDEEYNPLLTLAAKECNRMADMIRKLQEFYKPSQEEEFPLNIHHVLDDVCLLMKKRLQMRRIALEKHYCADVPLIVAVEDQLKQVFLNLLANAEEAVPEAKSHAGDRITLVTQIDSSNIRISIQDTGEGIPPENLNFIFEPFFSTKAVKGTGLGLYVSYGIIKKHGGNIEVASEPGKGTTFTISLPLKKTSKPDIA